MNCYLSCSNVTYPDFGAGAVHMHNAARWVCPGVSSHKTSTGFNCTTLFAGINNAPLLRIERCEKSWFAGDVRIYNLIIFVKQDSLPFLFYNIPMLWGWRCALHAQRRTTILALSMSLHVVATSPDGIARHQVC